jgi:hypothetical protein
MTPTTARQICGAVLQYSTRHMADPIDTGKIDLREISLPDIVRAAAIVKTEAMADLGDAVVIPNDMTIASVFTLLHHSPTGKVIAAVPEYGMCFKGLSIERVA